MQKKSQRRAKALKLQTVVEYQHAKFLNMTLEYTLFNREDYTKEPRKYKLVNSLE